MPARLRRFFLSISIWLSTPTSTTLLSSLTKRRSRSLTRLFSIRGATTEARARARAKAANPKERAANPKERKVQGFLARANGVRPGSASARHKLHKQPEVQQVNKGVVYTQGDGKF